MGNHEPVWCVKDDNGVWCTASGQRDTPEVDTTVATFCGDRIIRPSAVEKRRPTCGNCRWYLMRKEHRTAGLPHLAEFVNRLEAAKAKGGDSNELTRS